MSTTTEETMQTATRVRFSPHAERQCQMRDIPVGAVAEVIERKTAGQRLDSAAVFVGWTEDRGGLIGSNGDCVWAIVRDGVVATVMLRRSSQPATPAALRVSKVFGPRRAA